MHTCSFSIQRAEEKDHEFEAKVGLHGKTLFKIIIIVIIIM